MDKVITRTVLKYNELSPWLEVLRLKELLIGILQRKFNHQVSELTDIYDPHLFWHSIQSNAKPAWIVKELACFTSTLLSYSSQDDILLQRKITIDRVTKQQQYISHSSRSWKSKISVQAWSGFGENPPLGCRVLTFPYTLHGEEQRK